MKYWGGTQNHRSLFYSDELLNHLAERKAPLAVHIHLDARRIIKRIKCDQRNDCFVGFCLPFNKEGFPCKDAFIVETFHKSKDIMTNNTIFFYEQSIVAKPVNPVAPPFVRTDSKYTQRNYAECEFEKRNGSCHVKLAKPCSHTTSD